MPTVVVTDYSFPSLDIEEAILKSAGCELVAGQCKTPDELKALVADADAVITQFAPVNADVVAAMNRAKVIVRYGIGFDNVACDAARDRNIPVCNIPDYCIDEVADHTLAFILAATRGLRANQSMMTGGEWGLGLPLEQMKALKDQTVGIVGLGRIGKAVAARLRAFGCAMLIADPVVDADAAKELGGTLVGIDDLLKNSDVVTLHCPSTPQTRGIINESSLAAMKAGAILINVGRGDLVNLKALTAALDSGHISAAALDVFEVEPLPADSRLLAMNNVIVSSHVASASPKAVRKLRETAARAAVSALRGEPLQNIVNGVVVDV
ncbi:MAG: C-terminal binding protein [Planctomycetaceae bacterium]